MNADGSQERPEQAPSIGRRLRMRTAHAAGIAIIAAIPVLAAFRLLGDRVEAREASDGALRVSAETPSCLRHGTLAGIRVRVSSDSPVEVSISADYLARFSGVRAQPGTRLLGRDVVLDRPLEPGRDLPVWIELTPEDYGVARGVLRATSAAGERVEFALKTFVLP